MLLLSRLRSPAVRDIMIYGLATGVAALLTLVQTRVLWRAMTPSDFGLWALIDPMLLPVASLVMFGVDHAIVKQIRVDHLPLRVVVGSLLVSTLPATTACLLAIGLVAQFAFHIAWTPALVLTMVGEALILMTQTAFRSTGAVAKFAAVLLARNLLYLGVLLLLAANADGRLPVALVFLTRGGCVVLISLIAVLLMRPVPAINWTRYRDAVRYGFPLLLTTFIYALTDMTDRWFLAEFTGVIAVGVYAVHLKIAAILSQAIVIPFGMWFPPERFKRLGEADEGRNFFVQTTIVLSLICGYLSGAIWLARDLVLPLIAPGVVASPFVLACCLGGVTCSALSQAMNVGLLLPGHTGKNVVCTVVAVTAAVLGAAILVPVFGMNGAATSRLFGGLVLLVITAIWSYRMFPLNFPVFKMMLYFVASASGAILIDTVTAGYGPIGNVVALVAWTSATCAFVLLSWSHLQRGSSDARRQVREIG